jgi:glucose-6-phosphate dehydrogenase assembly protein OpcA
VSNVETFTSGSALRVDIGAIERELTRLWKAAAAPSDEGEGAVTRACLLNLIVWSEKADSGLSSVLASVVATHPSRVLLVQIDGSAPDETLEAFISAYCHRPTPGARQVCCEQVTFHASTRSAVHVPPLVKALEAADLPVCLFAPHEPSFTNPVLQQLARNANRLIVDSASFDSPASLRSLDSLAASLPGCSTGDLNWRRLRPIQDRIADFFDAAAYRRLIPHIGSLEIVGGPGYAASAYLLAGWIRTVLGGRDLEVSVSLDGSTPPRKLRTLRLQAAEGAETIGFVLEAEDAGDGLIARIDARRDSPAPLRVSPRPLEESQLLCGKLEAFGHDPLYEAALEQAASMTSRR